MWARVGFFTSMKSLTTLHVRPCTVWFQWEREFVYRAPKTMGRIWSRFCAMSDTMYSLFQRNRARSATCRAGEGGGDVRARGAA